MYDFDCYSLPQQWIHSSIIFVLCYWVKLTYVIFKIFEPVFISEMGLWLTFSGLLSLTSCCYFHENIWETSLLLLQLFLLNLGRVSVAKDSECSSKIPAATPPNKTASGAWHLFWDQLFDTFSSFFHDPCGDTFKYVVFPRRIVYLNF